LKDVAVIDVEARFIRAAADIDTADIRLLALIKDLRKRKEDAEGQYTLVTNAEIVEAWPEVGPAMSALTASLSSVGLILSNVTYDASTPNYWIISEFGIEFLDRLRSAGLEEEQEG
jgi:hypothetical protein